MKKRVILALLILSSAIFLWARENVTAAEVLSVKVEADSIVATFEIPEGMHLTIQEDYFYLDVDEVEGVSFEETIYPKGELDELGFENVHGTVHLIKKFTVADNVDKEKINFQIYAGFQLCYDSYCEAPVDSEFVLPLICEE
ncbi:MAG: hypothetical protein R6U84_09140 [Candidatus Cloacimonadales bacterium]